MELRKEDRYLDVSKLTRAQVAKIPDELWNYVGRKFDHDRQRQDRALLEKVKQEIGGR